MNGQTNGVTRLRVLVVDDEESILEFVQMGLEYEGFEVELAQDGPSARSQPTTDVGRTW